MITSVKKRYGVFQSDHFAHNGMWEVWEVYDNGKKCKWLFSSSFYHLADDKAEQLRQQETPIRKTELLRTFRNTFKS